MTAKLIEGIPISAAIREDLKERVAKLRSRGLDPGLAFVIVGHNPASISYVKGKAQACEEVGLRSQTMNLPEETTQEELLDVVRGINADPAWTGMIVQLPLPPAINSNAIAAAIDPAKDADAANPLNFGRLLAGMPGPKPCTPAGIQQLLIRSGNDPEGRHVVIAGRSNLVGKPL